MALFDDKRFLLSHIRHSFITGDDTGVCEMVMLHEMMPHHAVDEPDADVLKGCEIETRSELEAAQSYDIVSNIEMIVPHRRRSNTAQRLERLKLEKKNQSKLKVVHWKDGSDFQLNEQELDLYFPRRELPPPPPHLLLPSSSSSDTDAITTSAPIESRKSLLSLQLAQFPSMPVNPFNEYSRFDGRVGEGGQTKRIVIFLTMSNQRHLPMEVVTVCSARVQDLIGLICWQYTNENREPKLKPSVNYYCLRIAEENGDVDPDFPSLNPREPVGKFGFPILALVEKQFEEGSGMVVTVHINEMFSKIQIPSLDVTLQWVLDSTVKKRKATLEPGTQFGLERLKCPGVRVNLNTKVCDIEERNFKLVTIEEKMSHEEPRDDVHSNLPDLGAMEAPLYKCFHVCALKKLGRTADVQLGISGKKVDITPIASAQSNKISSSKLWKSWQPKAVTYNVENIVECEINHKKSTPERAVFKIVVFNGTEFQAQKFECSHKTATEIVKKLQYIMLMRTSSLRDDWLLVKEQKLQKKASHTHFPGFS